MSRAGVVDFPEFLRAVESGRFRAATDVFPVEPAPPDDPARKVEGLVLSPHRAGAMTDSLLEIGRQTVADAELIAARPAAALLPARPARDGGAVAIEADRAELGVRRDDPGAC